ncbi:MAG TPA: Hpt domain-containing protein [Methanotrichaceae archaeon]|nr:Hpt domain-containing protein [Methanotrichaceae archaeon]
MADNSEGSTEVLDKEVIASLRELQDEGEPDIIVELSDLFFENAPGKIQAIRTAIENGDAKALHVAAHSLKSSSSYLGATKLSAMAKELENMGRAGNLEGANEKLGGLELEYDRVRSALEVERKG